MRNFKKVSTHSLTEGHSNKQTVNVLNPDLTELKLRGRDWVDPKENHYTLKNKTFVKSIVQTNKEAVIKQTEQK